MSCISTEIIDLKKCSPMESLPDNIETVTNQTHNLPSLKLLKCDVNNLKVTLDIDGIFCLFDFNTFVQSFKSSLVVNIQKSLKTKASKINGKYNILHCKKYVPVNKFPSLKLGYIPTNIGKIDVFVISQNLQGISNAKFEDSIFENLVQIFRSANNNFISKQILHLNQDLSITGDLNGEDLFLCLNLLEKNLIQLNLKIYLESFGNKRYTTTSLENFNSLSKKIETFLMPECFEFVSVDFCLAVSSGKDKITFASSEIFNIFNVVPNYIPLLYNQLRNFNSKFSKPKNIFLDKNNNFIPVLKMNFYSTFKYAFNQNIFSKSSSIGALTSFLNQSFISIDADSFDIKLENRIKKLYNVSNYFSNCISKEFSYRLEFRCNIKFISSLIEFFFQNNILSYFSDMDSSVFFLRIQSTLDVNIKSICTGCNNNKTFVYTYDSFVCSIIIEKILNEIYIKGMRSVGNLSKEINLKIIEMINFNEKSLEIFDFTSTAINIGLLLSKDSKLKLIRDTIKYTRDINSLKQFLYNKLSDIYYNTNNFLLYEELINVLCIEATKNTETDLNILYKPLSDEYAKIEYYVYTKERFSGNKKRILSSIFFRMISEITELNSCEILKNLKIFLKEKSIHHVVKYSNKLGKYVFLQLILEHKVFISKIDELRNELKQIIFLNFHQTVKYDEDELIRYCSAMIKYKDSKKRFVEIKDDSSYGFFFTRNPDWLRNRFQFLTSIIRSQEYFITFMERVKRWRPNLFNLNSHFAYLLRFGITLEIDSKIKYEQLIFEHTKNWNETNFKTILSGMSYTNIFMSVIKGSNKYTNNLEQTLLEWENSNFNYSVLDNADKTETLDEFLHPIDNVNAISKIKTSEFSQKLNDQFDEINLNMECDENNNSCINAQNIYLEQFDCDFNDNFDDAPYNFSQNESFVEDNSNFKEQKILIKTMDTNKLKNANLEITTNKAFKIVENDETINKNEFVISHKILKNIEHNSSKFMSIIREKYLESKEDFVKTNLGFQEREKVTFANINILEMENQNRTSFLDDVFKVFRFCVFDIFDVRVQKIQQKYKLSQQFLYKSLEEFVKNMFLVKITSTKFKINFKNRDGNFINYNNIIQCLTKKLVNSKLSSNQLIKILDSRIRPPKIIWNMFLTDLVKDNVLGCTKEGNSSSKLFFIIGNFPVVIDN